jgi:NADPH:quinone reductase-like Zn-dependent oxidoreductase
MRAAVRTAYGRPGVVEVVDVPMPQVGDGDLLVRVHATTVNRTDCGFRSGRPFFGRAFYGFPRPRHQVLGGEFAGVVEAVGPAVSGFVPGERVFGYQEDRLGAHAEYLTIRADGPVATMPAGTDFVSMAPSTEASHYAVTLVRAAGLRRGDPVLVYGATGGIGSAAVQVLAYLGTDVTAVCDAQYVELVRGLGANRVVDRATTDYTQEDRSYRAIIDAVGKGSFLAGRRVLAPGGRYLSTDLGVHDEIPFLVLATAFSAGRRVALPLPARRTQDSVRRIRGLVEAGAFTPLVDRTYTLDHIVDAYRYVEAGYKVGNVVVTVAATDEPAATAAASTAVPG